jgi:hypothetical protein
MWLMWIKASDYEHGVGAGTLGEADQFWPVDVMKA